MDVRIFQTRVPSTLFAALKEKAYSERKSVNAVIVEAIAKLLNEETPE